jgi:phenylacetate-CoA ligase
MHALALIYVLRDIAAIDQFKVIQDSLEQTRILVTAAGPLSEALTTDIADRIRQRLGRGVRVSVEQVPEIPRERSGKYRYVVSHVAQPGAGAESEPHD